MKKTICRFTNLALIFTPFTVWFALNEYLKLNFLFICIAFVIDLIYCTFNKDTHLFVRQAKTKSQRLAIKIFLGIVLLSFIINIIFNKQPKLVSNFIGTFAIIFLLYYSYSSLIQKYVPIDKCIKLLAYSCLLLMLIIFVDSILANFFGIKIHEWFIIGYKGNTNYFDRLLWSSPCSPCEEPGAAAQYLNVLIPFFFLYFKGKIRVSGIILYGFCLFSLFSTTGIVTLLLISSFLWFEKVKSIGKIIVIFFICLLSFSTIVLYNNNDVFKDFIDQLAIVDKVSFSGNTDSDTQRSEGMGLAIANGLQSPIWGMGPGYGKSVLETGYLSTFLTFLGSYGFIGFFAFIAFWSSFIKKASKLNPQIRNYFLFSILACTVAAVIGDILHSFILWVLLPIINKAYNENKILTATKGRKMLNLNNNTVS